VGELQRPVHDLLGIGADADLVVFDPNRVNDRATYQQPAQYSDGIEYVFVGGVPIVWRGQLRQDTLPGQPLRATQSPQGRLKTAALRHSNAGRSSSRRRGAASAKTRAPVGGATFSYSIKRGILPSERLAGAGTA